MLLLPRPLPLRLEKPGTHDCRWRGLTIKANHAQDSHVRLDHLPEHRPFAATGGQGHDFFHDIHAGHHAAKGGVAGAPRGGVHRRGRSNEDREIARAAVGLLMARHGDGAIDMMDTGLAGWLERNERHERAAKVGIDAALDEASLRIALCARGPIKARVLEPTVVHIFHEIGDRLGRALRIQGHGNVAHVRLDADADEAGHRLALPRGMDREQWCQHKKQNGDQAEGKLRHGLRWRRKWRQCHPS